MDWSLLSRPYEDLRILKYVSELIEHRPKMSLLVAPGDL
jgi:hypothetical protein